MARKKRSLRTQWAKHDRQVNRPWYGNRYAQAAAVLQAAEDRAKAFAHLQSLAQEGPLSPQQAAQLLRLQRW